MRLTIRPVYYFLLAFALFLFMTAFLLEYAFGMLPCSLCIIARLLVFMIIILMCVALWHNPGPIGQRVYSTFCFLFSMMGVGATARQLWLIHSPKGSSIPDCSPGWEYLISNLPLHEAFATMLMGSKECTADVNYFLGLSLPAWTLIGFVILAIGSLLPWFGKRNL